MMLAAVIWTLLLGTLLPIAFSWTLISESERVHPKMLLGLLSASYCWLLLSCAIPEVSGPNYSTLRLIICNANIAASCGIGIILGLMQKPRALFVVCGAWVALGWGYFRGVSFVV
jgi:hypothetical protein